MSSHRGRRPRRRALGPAAVLALAAAVLVGGPGTAAWWSDEATVTGATVTSGTLDLVAGGDTDDDHTWAELTMADVAPGESVAGELVVANAGSVPFTLAVDGSGSGDLAPHVTVDVVVGGSASVDSAAYPRAASCSGTPSYSGVLGSSPVEVVPAGAALPAGDAGRLCVVLELDQDAPDDAQGDSFTPVFDLRAAQEAP